MYAVIEINEVGQVMHPRPFDWLARSPAFAHRLKVCTGGPELRMTIHAGLGRGYAREGGSLDRGMAIAAIYPVISDVMFMAELYGLFARNECEGVIARPRELRHKPERKADKKYSAKDGDTRDDISAAMKYLAHYFLNPLRESKAARAESRPGSDGLVCSIVI